MAKWHRTRRGDLGLRALGVGVLAVSYTSISYLMDLPAADAVHGTPGVVAYALTAIGFLSGSAGAALTLLGAHLFDEVPVSERWRVKPPVDPEIKIDDSAHVRSVTNACSAGQSSPNTPLRTERVAMRRGTGPLPRQAMAASIATFRRPEGRGNFIDVMVVPMSGQDRR